MNKSAMSRAITEERALRDRIEKLESALRRAQNQIIVGFEWKSIETAVKNSVDSDYVILLAYHNDYIVTGYWDNGWREFGGFLLNPSPLFWADIPRPPK